MSVDRQRNLFTMPKSIVFELNHQQQAVLDWAAYNDGKLAIFPSRLSKQSLRTMIANGLIERVGNPPRYVVTGIGWAVRGRGRGTKWERYGRPPLMASILLFHDDD